MSQIFVSSCILTPSTSYAPPLAFKLSCLIFFNTTTEFLQILLTKRILWASKVAECHTTLVAILLDMNLSKAKALQQKYCASSKLLRSCLTLCNPVFRVVGCQDALSMGFSRQEYQSGLPCPLPGELPDPGIKLVASCGSCISGRFFTAEQRMGLMSFNKYYLNGFDLGMQKLSCLEAYFGKLCPIPRQVSPKA